MAILHEPTGPGPHPFDPRDVVVRCIESGVCSLLLDADTLPPAFCDLGARVAGRFFAARAEAVRWLGDG